MNGEKVSSVHTSCIHCTSGISKGTEAKQWGEKSSCSALVVVFFPLVLVNRLNVSISLVELGPCFFMEYYIFCSIFLTPKNNVNFYVVTLFCSGIRSYICSEPCILNVFQMFRIYVVWGFLCCSEGLEDLVSGIANDTFIIFSLLILFSEIYGNRVWMSCRNSLDSSSRILYEKRYIIRK